jgi:hypothetical protein
MESDLISQKHRKEIKGAVHEIFLQLGYATALVQVVQSKPFYVSMQTIFKFVRFGSDRRSQKVKIVSQLLEEHFTFRVPVQVRSL